MQYLNYFPNLLKDLKKLSFLNSQFNSFSKLILLFENHFIFKFSIYLFIFKLIPNFGVLTFWGVWYTGIGSENRHLKNYLGRNQIQLISRI